MNIRDYLEHIKSKPEHVRRRIAVSTAGALTFLVLLGWGATIITSGSLALEDTEDTGVSVGTAARQFTSDFSGLAGAAAALEFGGEEGGITVVETKASSTLDEFQQNEATVIPF